MAIKTDLAAFGNELKRWRKHRRYSQLEVAGLAAVSQRHLSFLETGRSKPSPEMVEHLSVVLDLPLRARNSLLNAAGFAPAYSEEPLDGAKLANVRDSLQTLVDAHDPYPAYVVDGSWNILMANSSALLLTGMLLPPDVDVALSGNVLRLFLHPDGARNSVPNWAEVAAVLIERLCAECTHNPNDERLAALYAEVMSFDGVAELSSVGPLAVGAKRPGQAEFLTAITIATGDVDLRLYTAISTLGSAADVTLEELRLETLLPADKATADALRQNLSALSLS